MLDFKILREVWPFLLILPFVLITRAHSYLLFHTVIEISTVIVAFSVFLFAWNTRKYNKNNYFIFIGIVYLFVGGIDFLHTLTYQGVNIIVADDPNIPTQLWIAARYLLSASFLVAPVFLFRQIPLFRTISLYTLVFSGIILSIFVWQIFPDSFVKETGLTDFKIKSEYIISFIFILTAIYHEKYKNQFDPRVFLYIYTSIIFNIISELLFSLYTNVYDSINMTGHLFRLFSYYLIYKGILETGLLQPYDILFRELSELEQRKNDFINMASHELKTPVTSIKAYAQIMMHQAGIQKDKDRFYETAYKINEQADRINKLVNNYLDLSKIESGAFTFNSEEFDLQQLIKRLINDYMHIHNQKIIFKGKKICKIYGDEDRIRQVLANLLNNAIKYSHGNGEIEISLIPQGTAVTVSVKDAGQGIPEDIQSKIFSKYYRRNDQANKIDGLGLGLYITSEIIKGHNGRIWVESIEGKGSTFYFTLPLTRPYA